jgi:hypothetical protein
MSEAVARRTSSRRQQIVKKAVEKADMMEVDEEYDKENVENEKIVDEPAESDSGSAEEEGEAFDIKLSPVKGAPRRVGRAKKITFDSSSSSGQIIYGINSVVELLFVKIFRQSDQQRRRLQNDYR